ncbi:pyridoxamine 5'-phosphate oxidase family protein [Paenibacillus sp. EKM202P]|uniref:pyridoxamine 5'-phosphate oxidase family protein n=1 Tax=unclassified Paenibacillus TaxID=185978 RepID=UPI0013EA0F65|nr:MULTISPECIES: pyridoxamine 5'-phosphate oxidase family protein [unclassified Paenibacillus]KAF6560579.1 pyridoxamine 5'-phosphate oxidase family protein [Paenibacillus sp. EKM202P]KAF6565029.1 pyridoxamine 5'-phosphate oxidase family protein [Paenibacillus sp. EKM207P]MCV9952080.1 pyridoxamine 5'-phosphate oxidase family protein [Paenibacillus sp. BT-177]
MGKTETLDRSQLEQAIVKALDNNKFCSLGTVEGGKPKVRYMALFNVGMNIHLATDRKTHKVEELKENPNAYLLLGYEVGGTKEVLEVEATVQVTADEGLRKQVWNDSLKKWFSGPDDPDYVILDVNPTRIEYVGQQTERQVWTK